MRIFKSLWNGATSGSSPRHSPNRRLPVVLALFVALVLSQFVAAQTTPPNFIVINTDDMNAVEIDHMPVVQSRMVDEGLKFNNAFVTTPNCCPSRASFLTGLYTHNHQVLVNTPPLGGFDTFRALGNEERTIGTWLQRLGYRTGLVGKYLNRYGLGDDATYVAPGWDTWKALSGGQAYYGYKINDNGTLIQYTNAVEDYQTDVLAEHGLEFIRDTENDIRPFFLYLAPASPHTPFEPAVRHLDAFPEITSAPRPASFNEADVSDKPEFIRSAPLLTEDQIAKIDNDYRARLQMLLSVDEMVAAILDELEQRALIDNTYVIFTSDNGWLQGEHRFELGKRQPYDPSVRVPLVVRGPGVPAGDVRDQFVLHIDIGPTLIDLFGGRLPPGVDGRSFSSLLTSNPPPRWRGRFLIEHHGDGKGPAFNALRRADYLYVDRISSGEVELYDLVADPDHLDSIHDTADPALLSELAAELAALVACAGTDCRIVDR